MKKLGALLDEAKGGGSEKESAARDLIDAVKDGDAKAVALAFATLSELCSGGGYDEGDDDEDA